MKQENTDMKQETLKDTLMEVETNSNEEVTQLKLVVKAITTEFTEFKQENLKSIGKKRKL